VKFQTYSFAHQDVKCAKKKKPVYSSISVDKKKSTRRVILMNYSEIFYLLQTSR